MSCFVDCVGEGNSDIGQEREHGTRTGHCGSRPCAAELKLLLSNRSHGQTGPNVSDFTLPSRIIRKGLYSLERFKNWCAVTLSVEYDGDPQGFANKHVIKSPMLIPMTSFTPVTEILQPLCRSRP